VTDLRGDPLEGAPTRRVLERIVDVALEEDLGGRIQDAPPGAPCDQDVTTLATVEPAALAGGRLLVKEPGIICGLEALDVTLAKLDPSVEVTEVRKDGDPVEPGEVVATVSGPARAVLTGERTAINVIGHLSGIATLTRAFVDRAGGVAILDTRKTTPGLRALEKYAVRTGGGTNHRVGLFDAVLIKDNHIAAAGGVARAVKGALAASFPVQVECTTLEEVTEALDAGASSLLLDNCEPAELRELVAFVRKREPGVKIEASGGITLENVSEIAATGVDRISVGALTHSAPALDLSLELELGGPKKGA
jgi:nicotinate-nucleotide pyrophosphorylase (carboxylating)